MKVSLILASFFKANLLNLGLWSLSKQKIHYDLEIIILNDGIEDNTEQVCNDYKDKLNIHYFFTGQRNAFNKIITPRIPGFAQNIGVKQSSGDIIILSSPENFHLNNSVDLIINPLLENKELLTTPAIMYFDDCGKTLNYLFKNLTLNLPQKLLNKMQENPECHQAVKMPFFMGMWKEKFMEIGGYDEDLVGYACDDNDLISRLLCTTETRKGMKYYYTNSQIIHLFHGRRRDSSFHYQIPEWKYNYDLFQARKGQVIRNQNREWGKKEV